MHWRAGTVSVRTARWAGAVTYEVRLDDGGLVRAIGYLSLVGILDVGDAVLLNVSALRRGLGTGGYAFVIAAPDRLPADPPGGPGHIVKARYTPMQQLLLAVDEQESPHHAAMTHGLAAEGDLEAMPVVVADLHSALPAVLAGIRDASPLVKVAYLMTDGGALPLAFSKTVSTLREAGWLHTTITVGQAFGGDHEAVTLHSGLLAARHVLGADLAVVVQGPGNVGTGTPFGYSGVACGEALNAVHILGGRGIGALRVSDQDPRARHRGISHHSRTAYARILLGEATIVLPDDSDPRVLADATELTEQARGRLTLALEPSAGLLAALAVTPVELSSMGRGLTQDERYFVTQAAAGRFAGRTAQ